MPGYDQQLRFQPLAFDQQAVSGFSAERKIILNELPVRQQISRKVFVVDPVQADRFYDPVFQSFSSWIFRAEVCNNPWAEYEPGFLFHMGLLSAAIAHHAEKNRGTYTKTLTIVGILKIIITYNCSVKNDCR